MIFKSGHPQEYPHPLRPSMGYVVVILLSDGFTEHRIPYTESQRQEAEAFIATLTRHRIKAWLARP
jgi:hypothetical protein